jgi:glycerate kinase
MKGLKETSEKKDLEFETRKMKMKERADFENTTEGQEYLKNVKESPIAVKARMEFVDAELEKVKDQMRKLIDIKKADNATIKEYTPEELALLETPIDNPLIGVEEKGKNTVTYNKIEEEKEELPELDPKSFDIEKFNKMFESRTGGSSLPDVGFGSNSSLGCTSYSSSF